MNKNIINILKLIALISVFSSCQTEVKFNGIESAPQIVINATFEAGDTLSAYVGRSYFFLDKNARTNLYSSFANVGDRQYRDTSNYGVLADALVEYSVNNGAWKTMTIEEKKLKTENDRTAQVRHFKDDYVIQPGDRITIKASHSGFEEPSATQSVPMPFNDVVLNGESEYGQGSIEILLEPYTYKTDEELYLSFEYYCYYRYSRKGADKSINYTTAGFTSQNPIFEHAANNTDGLLNFSSIASRYMFAQASDIKEAMSITFYNQVYNPEIPNQLNFGMNMIYEQGGIKLERLICDSMVISVSVWTADEYKYFLTRAARAGQYPQETTNSSNYNEYTAIMQEVQSVINEEFGNEAPVQIYSNVDNGFGCVGAKAGKVSTLRFYE